jgi:hypothetical protein
MFTTVNIVFCKKKKGGKTILKARMAEHTMLHQGERKTYHARRKDSEQSPDQSWSIIMDNSDKIQIPHKVYNTTCQCEKHTANL